MRLLGLYNHCPKVKHYEQHSFAILFAIACAGRHSVGVTRMRLYKACTLNKVFESDLPDSPVNHVLRPKSLNSALSGIKGQPTQALES